MNKMNDGNSIRFGKNIVGKDKININIIGSNNDIFIADNVVVRELLKIDVVSSNSKLYIGSNTTFELSKISLYEDGNYIIIGEDCMFAPNARIYSSDFHSVISIDKGIRTNSKKGVIIHNHVWICNDVLVLKGSEIGYNSVVGAKSVVNRKYKNNSMIIGVPGRVLAKNIDWSRTLYYNNSEDYNNVNELIEDNNIVYNIERKLSNNNQIIEGWTFLPKITNNDSKVYLKIVRKNGKSEILKTSVGLSEDISKTYKNSNYSRCRFLSTIKKNKSVVKIYIIISIDGKSFYKEINDFKEGEHDE